MNIPRAILAIEETLAEAGSTYQDFCDWIGIDQSTWRKWREGKNLPQMGKWQLVQGAIAKVRSDRRRELARREGEEGQA